MELWALDEASFKLHGTIGRTWIPPEDRDPEALMQPTRESVGYFGAVRLADGAFVSSKCQGRFNAQTMGQFLRKLLRHGRKGKKKVAILDNVKYHHALLLRPWLKEVKDDLALRFIPAYSPDLNPIERFWKKTRTDCTHNRLFADTGELCGRLDRQFAEWRKGSEELGNLCAIS